MSKILISIPPCENVEELRKALIVALDRLANTPPPQTVVTNTNTEISTQSQVGLSGVGGRSALTHAGAIPKVAGYGKLSESVITQTPTDINATLPFTSEVVPSGTLYPGLRLDTGGAQLRGEVLALTDGFRVDILSNIYLDTTSGTWNLRDTSVPGMLVFMSPNINDPAVWQVYYASAGANPRTITALLTLDKSGNILLPSTSYLKIGTNQVVKSREADPGTAASSPSVVGSPIGGSAGATYTATEQGLINTLITVTNNVLTSLGNLKTQIDNLITDRDRLRTILQNHGLMA